MCNFVELTFIIKIWMKKMQEAIFTAMALRQSENIITASLDRALMQTLTCKMENIIGNKQPKSTNLWSLLRYTLTKTPWLGRKAWMKEKPMYHLKYIKQRLLLWYFWISSSGGRSLMLASMKVVKNNAALMHRSGLHQQQQEQHGIKWGSICLAW